MTIALAFNSNDVIGVSDPSTLGYAGFIVYHYTFPDTEINDWLVEKHVEFFPNPVTGDSDYPDLFTECSFATAQAVTLALEAAEGDTLPEAMIPAVEGLIFEGPKGTYGIRPSDHQALAPLYIAELDNLDSPEFAYLTLLSEVSPLETADQRSQTRSKSLVASPSMKSPRVIFVNFVRQIRSSVIRFPSASETN
jgi:branched-chain amino acid transport system substrate-binding protein